MVNEASSLCIHVDLSQIHVFRFISLYSYVNYLQTSKLYNHLSYDKMDAIVFNQLFKTFQ